MKDWSNNLPNWTSQFSVANRVDAMDCTSESFINIVYMMTGFDASPRALAKLSYTTEAGNRESNILQTANNLGLIPYPLWPSPSDFDWGSYYAVVPQDFIKKAMRCKVTIRPFDLSKSPGWTILQFPNGAQHAVAQINKTQYFDSELGSPVKNLTYGGAQIINQIGLMVTLMINCQTVKFADNKTFGILIDTPNGSQIIKATDEAQWRSWNSPTSYGKATVNPDGTTNWNAELQLNF